MACKFFVKLVFTDSASTTYATAAADGSAVAVEIGVFSIEPKPEFSGEDREYLGGVFEAANVIRNGFEIECFPFSSYQAVNGDSIPQNSNTLLYIQQLFASKKYKWIALPTAPKIAPPRWTDASGFNYVTALLPMRVEKVGIDISLNKENDLIGSAEEVTISLKAREI